MRFLGPTPRLLFSALALGLATLGAPTFASASCSCPDGSAPTFDVCSSADNTSVDRSIAPGVDPAAVDPRPSPRSTHHARWCDPELGETCSPDNRGTHTTYEMSAAAAVLVPTVASIDTTRTSRGLTSIRAHGVSPSAGFRTRVDRPPA